MGRNPVLEYLKAIETPAGAELLVQKGAHGKIIDTIIETARHRGVRLTFCEKGVLSRRGPSSTHQGVMLTLRRRDDGPGEEDFLDHVRQKKGVIVALDQMSDPHNVGSIIRTTEALGGDGVVLTRSHSAAVTPTVVKASAGATAHLKVLTVANMARFLEQAAGKDFWIFGTAADGDRTPEEIAGLRPAVVIIGGEGSGMRRLSAEKCNHLLRIPLRGEISSLNASVAAAIVLYEILKG